MDRENKITDPDVCDLMLCLPEKQRKIVEDLVKELSATGGGPGAALKEDIDATVETENDLIPKV